VAVRRSYRKTSEERPINLARPQQTRVHASTKIDLETTIVAHVAAKSSCAGSGSWREQQLSDDERRKRVKGSLWQGKGRDGMLGKRRYIKRKAVTDGCIRSNGASFVVTGEIETRPR